MAKRAAAILGRAVRTADAAGVSDRDLLRRFADDTDQSAFAAVVKRHTPLVYGVCVRVLHSAADADDATQAVFLVLAKKAKGGRWQTSIANWLYTTARKVAHNAKVAAVRRTKREGAAAVPERVLPADAMSGRELVAALDDELDKLAPRYREPLVLCYLEGLTRDDAATRLGLAVPALNKQLERGRKKLADALAARGYALGVLLLAVAATSTATASTNTVESILTAVGGKPSAAAVALAQGLTMKTVFSRAKLTALALVGLATLGFGAAAAMPSPADPPKADAKEKPTAEKTEAKPRTIRGTVVGPDGKPLAGVTINTINIIQPGRGDRPEVQPLAKTADDGSFTFTLDPPPVKGVDLRQVVATKPGFGPDWATVSDIGDSPVSLKLAADDVPVKGRITDLEGKPVAKAKVRVKTISVGDLAKVWERWPQSPYQALHAANKELWIVETAGLPDGVTADADGRFEITGVGRGRLVTLIFEGTGIETAACKVVTDPAFDPKKVEQPTRDTMPGGSFQPGPPLYAPTFTHAGQPTQPVAGTVTDAATGKPLAGVQVSGSAAGPHWWENNVSTKTDADGRFRLVGVAKADKVNLFVFGGETSAYLSYSTTVSGKPGLTEIAADLKLARGVKVKGRIVEKGTGKPVMNAAVRYTPLADNKLVAETMKDKRTESGMAWTTDKDGRFEFTSLPGSGVLQAQGDTRGQVGTEFTQVRMAKADLPRAYNRDVASMGESFTAADGHLVSLFSLSGYALIDPKATDETVDVTIEFDRGKSVSGKVLTADGQPAAGVVAYKLHACYSYPQTLKDGTFTAIALEADHPRTLLFVDPDKKLSATVDLKGDETGVTLKLQPWGKLSGRLLDADGKPLAGASVTVFAKSAMQHMAFNTATREHATATTDKDGKYELSVPGGPAEYMVGFSVKNKYVDTGYNPKAKGHVVKPGETTDAGDTKAKE